MLRRLLTLTTLSLLLWGCATTSSFPMRSALASNSPISKTSTVHIDALRDTEIEYRRAFYTCNAIAKTTGLNVSQFNKADFILYLNFTPNVKYNPIEDRYDSIPSVESGNPGVINAGAFIVGAAETKPEWEGSISVEDIYNTEEVDVALARLLGKFAEDFKGEI